MFGDEQFLFPLVFFLGVLGKTSPADLGLTVVLVTVFYFVQFFFGDVLESGTTFIKKIQLFALLSFFCLRHTTRLLGFKHFLLIFTPSKIGEIS